MSKELPLWELESRWTLESSKGDYKGQNPMDWEVFYIIGKLLKCKCLTWDRMTHMDTLNTSYGQKQFDSRPLKVGNRPNFLACRWRVTYSWKTLDKGYNFASTLISIEGLHTKLWGPKVTRISTLGTRDSHLGIPGKNVIWMWTLWKGIKYTIRGKVVASPKFGPWWVLWVWFCPWFILTPKMLKLYTNQLVIWFVQFCLSNWCLSFFLVPIPKLQHAPLTPKCYKPGNVPQLFVIPLFSP